ncbi:MAG: translation elongation factor Ts [Elusimicrobia bacterium RIFOXYA12_FULL_51_18]|nr:MAG: translation elongation factor Ts [Elusimicrobia bacterium RIFOXYA12_FULL_51_18]OGS29552.1 MAG: translation elongation factor Ts [Elusimicrobia bacterium RIFOXYA2_FULL_53_38]
MTVTITSEQVMSLRNQTGAGVMDCKNALKESAGDLGKAVEFLRKKGLAGLAKRAGRLMKEGVVTVKVSPDFKTLAMVEINCETDFVAKNPEVRALAEELSGLMLSDVAMANPAENEKAREKLQALAIKCGENMAIRRGLVYRAAAGTMANFYVHSDSKKAAIVELSFDGDVNSAKDDLMALAKELAMQSVAMSPKWLRKEDVPAELVEKEKEIYKAGPAAAGKTGIALEKMLEGRVKKFYQESCLLEQMSIREPKLSVAQVVKNHSDKLKGNIQVKKFDCYIIGME